MSYEGWQMHKLWLSTLATGRVRLHAKGNSRFKCKCGHRTTRRQLKKNGGVCFSCGAPLKQAGAGS